jgi:16S rRNA (guanine(527)-N(7))-methyltransferase RsmG
MSKFLDLFEKYGLEKNQQLAHYGEVLLEINQNINVTGAKSPEDLVLKHFADTMGALAVYTPRFSKIIDVGSGGGIPGIVLAIVWANKQTGRSVILVERRLKKAKVLKEILDRLELNNIVTVVSESFELAFKNRSRYQLDGELEIWLRGFLPGPKLGLYLTENFNAQKLSPLVLMKGPSWVDEMTDLDQETKISADWKKRFHSAKKLAYELPESAGSRQLVLL